VISENLSYLYKVAYWEHRNCYVIVIVYPDGQEGIYLCGGDVPVIEIDFPTEMATIKFIMSQDGFLVKSLLIFD
jgi:hypothetical protein